MSHAYQAVGWNRQKKIYDRTLWLGIFLYLAAFIGGMLLLHPEMKNNVEIVILRALGTCAFVLIHIILSIGPLCRLDDRFLPLLYNRRHMGVSMFLLALLHAILAIATYHSLGDMNPMLSVFLSNTDYLSIGNFPFEVLGFFALLILFMMAATSHDFWLSQLTAPVWKALHMAVYVAYVLLLIHVALGFLQTETGHLITALFAGGAIWVFGLHILAARVGYGIDNQIHHPKKAWVEMCHVDEIEENCAKIFLVAGDRVAVFKYDKKISAISNVCQHQNGPLGEGQIIDGYVTCPWHGFQYDPANGSSPPPFTEKVPTFKVKIEEGMIYVFNRALPAGTHVEPAVIS